MQLHDNAAAVFTSAGGGAHGHLALTMTAAEYLAVAKVAFKVPINPTADPVMVKARSRLESSKNLRLYELAKKDFRIYHDVNKALRNQLIAATPDTYLQELRDPDLGYANTSCLEIITHLRDTYGEIAQEDLNANQQRMTATWHPPIRPSKICLNNFEPVQPLLSKVCRDWRDKAQKKDRTMVLFKKHFKKWEKDRRLTLTTGTAGYHGANHVDDAPPAPVVAPPDAEMEAMRAEMEAMRVALAAQAAPPSAVPAARPALADMGYCWSHGYSGNVTHTSATCVHPAERHQVEATHANKLGGTERIWTRVDRRRTPR
eukprot:scaffold21179_cov47-Attheya_sp.AAC.4